MLLPIPSILTRAWHHPALPHTQEGLARIHKQKEKVLREQADTARDQRLCVICQENEKNTLLLPCRHLCLCKECSRREELDKCPLCRKGIDQKIDVFA